MALLKMLGGSLRCRRDDIIDITYGLFSGCLLNKHATQVKVLRGTCLHSMLFVLITTRENHTGLLLEQCFEMFCDANTKWFLTGYQGKTASKIGDHELGRFSHSSLIWFAGKIF